MFAGSVPAPAHLRWDDVHAAAGKHAGAPDMCTLTVLCRYRGQEKEKKNRHKPPGKGCCDKCKRMVCLGGCTYAPKADDGGEKFERRPSALGARALKEDCDDLDFAFERAASAPVRTPSTYKWQ